MKSGGENREEHAFGRAEKASNAEALAAEVRREGIPLRLKPVSL
jgi:hypothetical protein